MKQKKRFTKPYGLRSRFAISILLSLLLCSGVFFGLYYVSHALVAECFKQSSFKRAKIQRLGKDLQSFVYINHISSENLELLKKWEAKKPVILLELYINDGCIYSSYYESPNDAHSYDSELEDRDNVVIIELEDGPATAIIYSDFVYTYYVICTVFSIVTSLVLFVIIFLFSTRKMIRYICRLNQEVQIIEGGNLDYQVSVEGNDEITDLAKSMNRMRESFKSQMETEQQLYLANKQLITEMSHDIRTPLTGILLYLEILRSHRFSTEEQLQDYLKKIDDKANHMKTLTDHLFEYSLKDVKFTESDAIMKKEVFSDEANTPVSTELVEMEAAFSSVITELKDELESNGFIVILNSEWYHCLVKIHPEYLTRIRENLISNLRKYADPGSEIRIDTINDTSYCGFSIVNICCSHAENVESNGIGIESIQSMMRQMTGCCTIETDGTFYEITLLFLKQ